MSYALFLDDERTINDVTWLAFPEHNRWSVVRTMDDFIRTIYTFGVPAFITFDHDLADQDYVRGISDSEKTGYSCAKWLVDFCYDRGLKFPGYEVHSMNPIGRKRIRDYIESAKEHMGI